MNRGQGYQGLGAPSSTQGWEETTIACNLCGQDNAQELFVKGHPHGGLFRYVRCSGCELVYVNPQPKDLGRLYGEDYFGFGAAFDLETNLRGREHYSLLQRLTRRGQAEKGKLLDIGCGKGNFLRRAQAAGWETYGLEISPYAAIIAREELGRPVHQGDLASAPFAPQSFQVITAFDVLEHMADPFAAMQRIKTLLSPKGLLILEVPNHASLYRSLRGPSWLAYDPYHIFFFAARTLVALLARAGLRPFWLTTWGVNLLSEEGLWRLGWAPFLIRLVDRLRLKRLLRPLYRRPAPSWGEEAASASPQKTKAAAERPFQEDTLSALQRRLKALVNAPLNLLMGRLLLRGDRLVVAARKED